MARVNVEISAMPEEFVNKKPQSTYKLTKTGISNFKEYVEMLVNNVSLSYIVKRV